MGHLVLWPGHADMALSRATQRAGAQDHSRCQCRSSQRPSSQSMRSGPFCSNKARIRTGGRVLAHRIWERITLATACGTLPGMCSLRLLEARCACMRTFPVSHVSPGRQGERHICAGAHDETRNDAAGGGGRNQVLSDLCLRTKARTFKQARSTGDCGRVINGGWSDGCRWCSVSTACANPSSQATVFSDQRCSHQNKQMWAAGGCAPRKRYSLGRKIGTRSSCPGPAGQRSDTHMHIAFEQCSTVPIRRGPSKCTAACLLTVQSLEVQFPPVSAMMFALTAMMYAIYQHANAKSQFSSFGTFSYSANANVIAAPGMVHGMRATMCCDGSMRATAVYTAAIQVFPPLTVRKVTVPARISRVNVDLRSLRQNHAPNCRGRQAIGVKEQTDVPRNCASVPACARCCTAAHPGPGTPATCSLVPAGFRCFALLCCSIEVRAGSQLYLKLQTNTLAAQETPNGPPQHARRTCGRNRCYDSTLKQHTCSRLGHVAFARTPTGPSHELAARYSAAPIMWYALQ